MLPVELTMELQARCQGKEIAYEKTPHFKKKLRDSWICFDQTFPGRGKGILFPARETLVSDIPAGDGNPLNLFFTVHASGGSNIFNHFGLVWEHVQIKKSRVKSKGLETSCCYFNFT